MNDRLRLEEWQITPTCRANRGHDGAWEEAVRQLREVYDAQEKRFGDAYAQTYVVSLERVPLGPEYDTRPRMPYPECE